MSADWLLHGSSAPSMDTTLWADFCFELSPLSGEDFTPKSTSIAEVFGQNVHGQVPGRFLHEAWLVPLHLQIVFDFVPFGGEEALFFSSLAAFAVFAASAFAWRLLCLSFGTCEDSEGSTVLVL